MKKLLTLALAVVALGLTSWAEGSTINSTKSNTFRLTYSADLMSQAQATKIIGQLDGKNNKGERVDEVVVRQVLKENGVQADHVKKIIIKPAIQALKQTTIILLTNPADEAQALAISDAGSPADKK